MKFFIAALALISATLLQGIPHYYCTPCDERHYYLLKNLIGSIHHADFKNLAQIAVFDLGLTKQQRAELITMQKVKVYDLLMIHPDLLTYFITDPYGRTIRGYFAWKPVIIKQALDMFPSILYLDAGSTVLQPLDDLFEHIQTKGYFLISCSKNPNCNLANRLTQPVITTIIAKRTAQEQACAWSQDTYMIDAGLQGISRALMHSYVLPMYGYALNLDLFKDDGSAILGYGAGRHDQTLFTLLAHWLKLTIHEEGSSRIHWDRNCVTNETIIYRSRGDHNFDGGRTRYIRYEAH